MAVPAVLSPRPAIEEDRSRLASLLHFETYVHRHLDWRRPLDWLGQEPYLILEQGGRLSAALACPPDPQTVAWIRLFASATRVNPNQAWKLLWGDAMEQLRGLQVSHAAAIPLHDWFKEILAENSFAHAHNVVVLDWRPEGSIATQDITPPIRPMTEGDIPHIFEVDHAAFAPLWQNSERAIQLAFEQASLATVCEVEGQVAAFQISTPSSQGLHLARLATHPSFQGRGLGKALVRDVQNQVAQRNISLLTVNTQDNNTPSLALYQKLGFRITGEQYPVYQFELN